jgi:hypothetical protein
MWSPRTQQYANSAAQDHGWVLRQVIYSNAKSQTIPQQEIMLGPPLQSWIELTQACPLVQEPLPIYARTYTNTRGPVA